MNAISLGANMLFTYGNRIQSFERIEMTGWRIFLESYCLFCSIKSNDTKNLSLGRFQLFCSHFLSG